MQGCMTLCSFMDRSADFMLWSETPELWTSAFILEQHSLVVMNVKVVEDLRKLGDFFNRSWKIGLMLFLLKISLLQSFLEKSELWWRNISERWMARILNDNNRFSFFFCQTLSLTPPYTVLERFGADRANTVTRWKLASQGGQAVSTLTEVL